MKKLKILLDYDDTTMIRDSEGIYREHPRAEEIIQKHNVIIYSGNPEAEQYANKHRIPFIFKGGDDIPVADVLIDDMVVDIEAYEFSDFFRVKESFISIDAFLEDYPL